MVRGVGIDVIKWYVGLNFCRFNGTISLICSLVHVEHPYKWICDLDSTEEFTMSSIWNHIEAVMLDGGIDATGWNKYVLKNVNIMMWISLFNRLQTKVNLKKTWGLGLCCIPVLTVLYK